MKILSHHPVLLQRRLIHSQRCERMVTGPVGSPLESIFGFEEEISRLDFFWINRDVSYSDTLTCSAKKHTLISCPCLVDPGHMTGVYQLLDWVEGKKGQSTARERKTPYILHRNKSYGCRRIGVLYELCVSRRHVYQLNDSLRVFFFPTLLLSGNLWLTWAGICVCSNNGAWWSNASFFIGWSISAKRGTVSLNQRGMPTDCSYSLWIKNRRFV